MLGVPPPSYYMLQGLDTKTRATKITINGAENSALNNILGELFSTIDDRRAQEAVDFLGSILPK